MPVLVDGGICRFVRLAITPQEIPELLKAHRRVWAPPDELEAVARALREGDFPEKRSAEFAESVIRWGRGQRFVDRFLHGNSATDIAAALRRAVDMADQGNVSRGVAEVQQLNYLGQSFASKLVRFLCPDRAVILDDVIRSSLGYMDTREGYDEFLADCTAVLNLAREQCPSLRVCDVEAAIFAKLQGC